jgi:hypothetical protein
MANSQLAQHIADNQQLAAQTQQALRNNRRVIRHPVATSEPEPPATTTPPVVKHQAIPSTVATSSPPYDDTIDDAIPSEPPALSSPRTPALVKPKRASNVVTLPNANITVSPLDLPTELFSAGLDRRKQNRHLLMQWLSSALVDTIDYGRIHVVGKDRCQLTRIGKMADCMEPSHWSKPCLFKPGAEKISSALGVTVHYPSLREYESAVLANAEIHMIVLRCELRDAHGNVVAEGIGARDLRQDFGDINKALKMCAKSAHIDAVLRLAGISSLFTQDIEDRPPRTDNGETSFVDDEAAFPDFNPVKAQTPQRSTASGNSSAGTASKTKRQVPTPSPPSSTPAPESTNAQRGDGNELVSRAELAALRQAIVASGFTEKRVVAWLVKSTQGEVTTLEQLRKPQYASLLTRLDQWAEAEYFQQQPSNSTSTSTTRP